MKKLSASLLVVTLLSLACVWQLHAAEKKKVNPASIHGRIQLVTSFPDYRVQAVTGLADVRVKIVKSLPHSGEWQIVSSFPDYRIELVNALPDFTVEFDGGVPSAE
jgi:hypothetical protein